MVVIGYKHNTSVFGTDAEKYVGRILWMYNNPDGHRRPDLVSINGRYSPIALKLNLGLMEKFL